MFENIDSLIENYDRDKRQLAELSYDQMFKKLQSIETEILEIANAADKSELLSFMREIAKKMQALNNAVCAFEHEKVSDLANDCPPRADYSMYSKSADEGDDDLALAIWLSDKFPTTWPK